MHILLSLTLLSLLAPGPRADDADLHAPYGALLSRHVTDGVVDYAGLATEEAVLDAYVAALGAVDPATLDRDAQVAFWVNAYNAFTLKLILDYYPDIEGIKDIPGSKRWKHERWTVDGKDYSLDQIEHEILRPMGDARVHFVLVCASKSCPDLPSEAVVPERLDEQLDGAARRFLADESKGLAFGTEPGVLWGENHVLRLSKIFSWFDEDFGDDERELVDFVLQYAPADAVTYVKQHGDDLDVEHFDYDWTLNGR
jgi:hypothetical protein